jgi:coenzyme F420-reducing hydrogenase gamma subunit
MHLTQTRRHDVGRDERELVVHYSLCGGHANCQAHVASSNLQCRGDRSSRARQHTQMFFYFFNSARGKMRTR